MFVPSLKTNDVHLVSAKVSGGKHMTFQPLDKASDVDLYYFMAVLGVHEKRVAGDRRQTSAILFNHTNS